MSDNFHIPVLSNITVEYLINEELRNQVIVDGTLGGGSYTKLICEKLGSDDKVISIDKDINAIEYAKEKLKGFDDKIIFINDNFGELVKLLNEKGIEKITGLVLDLGLSSYQLEAEEGFSFMRDTNLDMRAFKKDDVTASVILNSYKKDELTGIFENFGEIGNAERLSKAIIETRKTKRIDTTFDLVDVIKKEYNIGSKNSVDFLAKIFQSLRIKVNNELENLEKVLMDSLKFLIPGGRIVIISYHSLEDRIVKNFFKEESKKTRPTDNPYFDEEIQPKLRVLTKKVVVPSREEISSNSRARSARLRCAEVIY